MIRWGSVAKQLRTELGGNGQNSIAVLLAVQFIAIIVTLMLVAAYIYRVHGASFERRLTKKLLRPKNVAKLLNECNSSAQVLACATKNVKQLTPPLAIKVLWRIAKLNPRLPPEKQAKICNDSRFQAVISLASIAVPTLKVNDCVTLLWAMGMTDSFKKTTSGLVNTLLQRVANEPEGLSFEEWAATLRACSVLAKTHKEGKDILRVLLPLVPCTSASAASSANLITAVVPLIVTEENTLIEVDEEEKKSQQGSESTTTADEEEPKVKDRRDTAKEAARELCERLLERLVVQMKADSGASSARLVRSLAAYYSSTKSKQARQLIVQISQSGESVPALTPVQWYSVLTALHDANETESPWGDSAAYACMTRKFEGLTGKQLVRLGKNISTTMSEFYVELISALPPDTDESLMEELKAVYHDVTCRLTNG